MYFNTLGFSTPRALAFATLAAVSTLGVVSGVFGTFTTSIISGQSCSGYGYFAGYGYGYDCTPITPSGGGGGGGGSSTVVTPIVTVPASSGTTVTPPSPTVTPSVSPVSVVIFPEFVAECSEEVKDLTDSRLTAYYTTVGVLNKSNTGRKLTRAEFLKLLINGAGTNVSQEANPNYSDVSSTNTLRKYIAYATRAGIVSGQGGKFRPNDLISRAEVAKILVRSTKISMASIEVSFADVSTSSTLSRYIQTAFDNCILHGRRTLGGEPTVGSRVFEPNDGITLAETIKVLYNISR